MMWTPNVVRPAARLTACSFAPKKMVNECNGDFSTTIDRSAKVYSGGGRSHARQSYDFKPNPEEMSFGELMIDIARSQLGRLDKTFTAA